MLTLGEPILWSCTPGIAGESAGLNRGEPMMEKVGGAATASTWIFGSWVHTCSAQAVISTSRFAYPQNWVGVQSDQETAGYKSAWFGSLNEDFWARFGLTQARSWVTALHTVKSIFGPIWPELLVTTPGDNVGQWCSSREEDSTPDCQGTKPVPGVDHSHAVHHGRGHSFTAMAEGNTWPLSAWELVWKIESSSKQSFARLRAGSSTIPGKKSNSLPLYNSWKQPSPCLTREPTQSTEKLHCPFNSPMESGAWTENPTVAFHISRAKPVASVYTLTWFGPPKQRAIQALGPILVTSRARKLIHSSPITEYSAQSLTRESRQLQSLSYGLTWPTAVLPTCSYPVTHISYPHF